MKLFFVCFSLFIFMVINATIIVDFTQELPLSPHPEYESSNTYSQAFGEENYLELTLDDWQVLPISPIDISTYSVWSADVRCFENGQVQGIAFQDEQNILKYSLFGVAQMDIEEWIPVYQGSKSLDSLQNFLLPIADDWFAKFDYYPTISSVVFISDVNYSGQIQFHSLEDITDQIAIASEVNISHSEGNITNSHTRNHTINFSFLLH